MRYPDWMEGAKIFNSYICNDFDIRGTSWISNTKTNKQLIIPLIQNTESMRHAGNAQIIEFE